MYETYWNLNHNPFSGSSESQFYHESPAHEEALARLQFLVERHRRVGVLTGPTGTGKSLLLRVLLDQSQRGRYQGSLIDATHCDAGELTSRLGQAFGISVEEATSPAALWFMLEDELRGRRAEQAATVLLIDHLDQSDNAACQVLDRLLSICESTRCTMTVIVAAAQIESLPPDSRLLNLCELRISLETLDRESTSEYITDHVAQAGCERELFTAEALGAIYDRTQGVPRAIDRLGDLSLLAGMGESASAIDEALVVRAATELPGELAVAIDDV
jgi:type II secretory pathway predicted ATPase ExeA